MTIKHLGLNLRKKESNHINKEIYLSAKPEGMSFWKESDYPRQREKASVNFDMNMRYFASLDQSAFTAHLIEQCSKFNLSECLDLNELDGVSGLYLLILDEYKQVYIGVTQNIKKRILSHWHNRKSLERLIFGDIFSSGLSIDSFGALDTTRVFYLKSSSPYPLEKELVDSFDSKYTLNRTSGGIGDPTSHIYSLPGMAEMAVITHKKEKFLLPFVDSSEIKSIFSEDELCSYLKKYPELKKILYPTNQSMI